MIRLKISKKDKEDLIRFNKYLNWKYGETKTYIKNKEYDMIYVTNYTINMANQMIALVLYQEKLILIKILYLQTFLINSKDIL